MVGQQLALPSSSGRLLVEPMLEDRLGRSVGTGADVEAAVASRFQPVGAVLVAQAQDADASAVALPGVRPAFEDQLGELGGAGADCRRVDANACKRPLGIAPMGARHVLGECRMPATPGAAQMHRDPLAPCLRRGKLLRNSSTVRAVTRTSSCSRISRYGTE
jgi:hypothetical protein